MTAKATAEIELGTTEFWTRLDAEPARVAYEVAQIDLVDLQGTLQRHPAIKAWVIASFEGARIAEERAKWELTKARAQALLKAAAEFDPSTGKRKTVDVINSEADLDPKVQAAQDTLFSYERRRGALRAMVEALDDRKDMLVQLAAKQRDEERDYK